MQAKTFIVSVLVMSFFMAQIPVDAWEDCCPTADARKIYNHCRFLLKTRSECRRWSGCIKPATCPPGYTNDMLENTVDGWAWLQACCPNPTARRIFNRCNYDGIPVPECRDHSGCMTITDSTCATGYPYGIPKNTAVNEYCKLGCVSSVCGGALTTFKNSDESKIVNGALEKCDNECSTICSKNSKNEVETA